VVHIPMRAIPTFGDDTSAWLEEMDHVVRQQGEIFVCPENFANCFITGDVVKMWYMNEYGVRDQRNNDDESWLLGSL
jgi:hypothetical protein